MTMRPLCGKRPALPQYENGYKMSISFFDMVNQSECKSASAPMINTCSPDPRPDNQVTGVVAARLQIDCKYSSPGLPAGFGGGADLGEALARRDRLGIQ